MSYKKWINPTNTKTYNSWRAMRHRCLYNNQNKHYKLKGITICEEWESYDKFFEDMGERPIDTTLDRIDNNKGYFKENCRWSNWNVQENNKESLRRFEYQGKKCTIGEWVTILNLTKKERVRVYKRVSKYNANSYEELFSKHLREYRTSQRVNKCLDCGLEKTCKWRKDGTQCNTCYHKKYRSLLKLNQ